MAGANNAQMKVAGWKARDITKARAERGKLSHEAMRSLGHAPRKGFDPQSRTAKPKAEPPSGWRAAARGDSPGAKRRDAERVAAREEARRVYQAGNEAARGKHGEMRSDIRARVASVRAYEREFRDAQSEARTRATKALPEIKGGKDARNRRVARDRQISEMIDRDPAVVRTAQRLKAERDGLRGALASRNQTAKARQSQRAAESAGQMDLFGAPSARPRSPFERRVEANQRAAAGLRDLAGTMMARRQAAATAAKAAAAKPAPRPATASTADLIRQASFKRGGGGFTPQSYRSDARKALVDAGTARAKMREAERMQKETIESIPEARRMGGKYAADKRQRAAEVHGYYARRAREEMSGHVERAKHALRVARRIEADLPADVRASIKPKRDTGGLGVSADAKAKMAAVRARLPELRAARTARLERQLQRGETIRQLAQTRERLGRIAGFDKKKNSAMEARGAKSRNRALATLERVVGSNNAIRKADVAGRVAKSESFRRWKEQSGWKSKTSG